MSEAYQMVLTSVVSVATLSGLFFFWRYIFPRRPISYLTSIIFISILPVINMWRPGIDQSGDMGSHVMFLMSFFRTLQQGIWWPRWSSEFCSGFGYPHSQFFYPLPYYLGSGLHFLGFSFINSIKMIFSLAFVGAGITMFAWLKAEFSRKPAFVGTLLYLFAPYQLISLHFTNALGESLAFALVPLIFFCIKKVSVLRQNFFWQIILTLTVAALILTHHIVPIIALPVAMIYAICLQKKKPLIWTILLCIFAAIGLTAFHWLPLLSESKWVQQTQMQQVNFPQVWEFFWSPWRGGFLFQGHYGEVSSLVGYGQLLVVIIGLFLISSQKISKKDLLLLKFFFIFLFVLLVMMQAFMSPIWMMTPILKNFQNSRRLLFMITILSAAVGALVTKYVRFKKIVVVLFCVFVVLSTILNWGSRAMDTKTTEAVLQEQMPGRCDRVAVPVWADRQKLIFDYAPRLTNLTLQTGQARYIELSRSPVHHRYLIDAQTDVTVVENTTYFPNWVAKINDRQQAIENNNPAAWGLMTFRLQPGLYFLDLTYQQTTLEKMASSVSLLTAGLLLVFLGLKSHRFFCHQNRGKKSG